MCSVSSVYLSDIRIIETILELLGVWSSSGDCIGHNSTSFLQYLLDTDSVFLG